MRVREGIRIIPATGLGTRMGRTAPEKEGISRNQFMLLSGSPIPVHAIRKFVSAPSVAEIVVALRPDDMEWAKELFEKERLQHVVGTVVGGEVQYFQKKMSAKPQFFRNTVSTAGFDYAGQNSEKEL